MYLLQLSLWNFLLFMFYDYPGRIIISWLCFIGWCGLHTFRKTNCWKDKYRKYGCKWLITSIFLHIYPLKIGKVVINDVLFSFILFAIWYVVLVSFYRTPFKLYEFC